VGHLEGGESILGEGATPSCPNVATCLIYNNNDDDDNYVAKLFQAHTCCLRSL